MIVHMKIKQIYSMKKTEKGFSPTLQINIIANSSSSQLVAVPALNRISVCEVILQVVGVVLSLIA